MRTSRRKFAIVAAIALLVLAYLVVETVTNVGGTSDHVEISAALVAPIR